MSEYGAVTLVVRPSVKAYAASTAALGLYAAPVLVALLLVNRDTLGLAAILGVVALCSVGGVLLYMARARVFVTGEYIGKRGFTTTRWMRTSAVGRSLLVRRLVGGVGTAGTELFLFAPDDVMLLRLKNSLWSVADLERIAESTGAEGRVLAHSYTLAQLDELEPTALTSMEKNPKRTAAMVVVGFFVVATPLAYLYAVTTTR